MDKRNVRAQSSTSAIIAGSAIRTVSQKVLGEQLQIADHVRAVHMYGRTALWRCFVLCKLWSIVVCCYHLLWLHARDSA